GLGERAVIDLERAARLRQICQGHIALASTGVMQHRLTVRESPALSVLPGETHIQAVGQERCESKRFRVPPIDAAVVYGIAAAGKGALKRRMELERRRPLEQLLVEGDELLRSYRGFARLGELRLLRPHDGILVGVGV